MTENGRHTYEALTRPDGSEGFRCLGSYSSVAEAIERVRQEFPDAVLYCDGLNADASTKERYSGFLLLVIPLREDDEHRCNAQCQCLRYGMPAAHLLENVAEPQDTPSPVIVMFHENRPQGQESSDLTIHEMRLLKMLVDGHNYTTAALELGVSYNTVKYHTRRMYRKLRVHSKSEAVSKALQNRLID
jgi:DNA-binding NarL/FixJ family response regulator